MSIGTYTLLLIFVVLLSYIELGEQKTPHDNRYNLPRRINHNNQPRPAGQNNQIRPAAPNNQIRLTAQNNQIRPVEQNNQIRPVEQNNQIRPAAPNNNPVEDEDDEPPPALVTPDGRVIVNGVMVGWDHNGFVVDRRPEDNDPPVRK